jgi:tetraacyldisaccharide 4'-kinase
MAAMLKIFGSTWGTLARARASLYAGGWLRSRKLERPVVSVGALSVGGAGKTPTTALLAALLREAGLRPAILSRGYRRQGNAPLLVSAGDGGGPRVTVAQAGDEPYWLSCVLPEVAVAVAARREDAARLALANGPRDVFLLDDGYQHLRVARDANLLVVNPEAPFWDDSPMPSGRLRESPSAAARADAFLVIGADEGACATLRQRYGALPRYMLVRQPASSWPAATPPPAAASQQIAEESLPLPRVPLFAFAGIARPHRFFDEISERGLDLRGWRSFPDHHAFSAAELAEVERAARDAGAELLLTTEKDSVRLPGAATRLPVHVWGYRLAPRAPRELLDWLIRQAGLEAWSDAA